MKISLFLLIFATLFSTITLAQSDELDSTFNKDGIANFRLPSTSDLNGEIVKVAIQPDGKILSAGKYSGNNFGGYLFVTRGNSDGSPDNSFGRNGVVKIQKELVSHGLRPYLKDIVIQPDGKILLFAQLDKISNNWVNLLLIRLNADGSRDETFGTKVIFSDTSIINMEPYPAGMALQQDGKIVIIGSGNSPDFGYGQLVFRLNPDGTKDDSFGNNGIVFQEPVGDFDILRFNNISVDSKGRIICCGYEHKAYVRAQPFLAVRYLPSGQLDDSFANDGIFLYELSRESNEAKLSFIEILSGDTILLGGSVQLEPELWLGFDSTNIALIRLDAAGQLDPSFGLNGVSLRYIGSTVNYSPFTDMAIDKNGKIMFVGNPSYSYYALWRFNKDGNIDSSYANAGEYIFSHDEPFSHAIFISIAFQEDNKLVVGGQNSFSNECLIVRFKNDESGIRKVNSSSDFFSVEQAEKVSVFPNPAHDFITISGLSEKTQSNIQLVDNSGKILRALKVSGKTISVNVSDLENGIYYIRIIEQDKVVTKKMLKQ